jgi:hypothetical protein
LLRGEAIRNGKASLLIILEVMFCDPDPTPNACVRIILGDVAFNARITVGRGERAMEVWAVVPDAALGKALTVNLQVLSEAVIIDQFLIGILRPASAPGMHLDLDG